MVFDYPLQLHMRRHGPQGYASYHAFKPWLRDEFLFRCVFCLRRERWEPGGHAAFGVDHFVPQSIAPDLVCDYSNLLYVCLRCNAAKGTRLQVLDPCQEALGEQLRVQEDGRIEGLTAAGMALIQKLELDAPDLTAFRQRMLRVLRVLAESPHPEAAIVLKEYLSFPDDLPDLRPLRPPAGNSRPGGITTSSFVLRDRGLLPTTY